MAKNKHNDGAIDPSELLIDPEDDSDLAPEEDNENEQQSQHQGFNDTDKAQREQDPPDIAGRIESSVETDIGRKEPVRRETGLVTSTVQQSAKATIEMVSALPTKTRRSRHSLRATLEKRLREVALQSSLRDELLSRFGLEYDDPRTIGDLFVDTLLLLAFQGNVPSIIEILNRVEGKVSDKLGITVTPLYAKQLEGVSLDQL